MSEIDIHQKQDMEGVEKKWQQFQDENDISKIEDIKDEITDTIINVESKPIDKVKEERKARRPVITDEEKKAYIFKHQKSLFS